MKSEFMTTEEVAEYLRLPLSTTYKFAQERLLPEFLVCGTGGLDGLHY